MSASSSAVCSEASARRSARRVAGLLTRGHWERRCSSSATVTSCWLPESARTARWKARSLSA